LGSVVGSVLGASLLVYVMELLREFKSTQEIVFGAVRVGFMVFQPHGLVSFFKRWLPGWEEPVHLGCKVGPELAARDEPVEDTHGQQSAVERV
jgi:hypothetical protein